MTPAKYMEKAERALAGARLLLEARDTEGACNRAYYAMFDAARAALLAARILLAGEDVKTHAGLIAAFGKHLVQTGLTDPEFGRSFNKIQRLRLLADYTGDNVALADAARAVEQAAAFVQAMRDKFLPNSPSSPPQ
jgi:uncharacterized protein (UPF0332 family)